MGNKNILGATTRFCKTKQFVIGASGTTIIFSIIIMGFVNPMIDANSEDIDHNREDIKNMVADVSTNTESVSNIDQTLQKLDVTIEKLDDNVDKMTAVICDMTDGKHC